MWIICRGGACSRKSSGGSKTGCRSRAAATDRSGKGTDSSRGGEGSSAERGALEVSVMTQRSKIGNWQDARLKEEQGVYQPFANHRKSHMKDIQEDLRQITEWKRYMKVCWIRKISLQESPVARFFSKVRVLQMLPLYILRLRSIDSCSHKIL